MSNPSKICAVKTEKCTNPSVENQFGVTRCTEHLKSRLNDAWVDLPRCDRCPKPCLQKTSRDGELTGRVYANCADCRPPGSKSKQG